MSLENSLILPPPDQLDRSPRFDDPILREEVYSQLRDTQAEIKANQDDESTAADKPVAIEGHSLYSHRGPKGAHPNSQAPKSIEATTNAVHLAAQTRAIAYFNELAPKLEASLSSVLANGDSLENFNTGVQQLTFPISDFATHFGFYEATQRDGVYGKVEVNHPYTDQNHPRELFTQQFVSHLRKFVHSFLTQRLQFFSSDTPNTPKRVEIRQDLCLDNVGIPPFWSLCIFADGAKDLKVKLSA